jgi:hypothetical protein
MQHQRLARRFLMTVAMGVERTALAGLGQARSALQSQAWLSTGRAEIGAISARRTVLVPALARIWDVLDARPALSRTPCAGRRPPSPGPMWCCRCRATPGRLVAGCGAAFFDATCGGTVFLRILLWTNTRIASCITGTPVDDVLPPDEGARASTMAPASLALIVGSRPARAGTRGQSVEEQANEDHAQHCLGSHRRPSIRSAPRYFAWVT